MTLILAKYFVFSFPFIVGYSLPSALLRVFNIGYSFFPFSLHLLKIPCSILDIQAKLKELKFLNLAPFSPVPESSEPVQEQPAYYSRPRLDNLPSRTVRLACPRKLRASPGATGLLKIGEALHYLLLGLKRLSGYRQVASSIL
jgi:hypothetical protein